jgi:Fe-S-cluster-containing hydrogenase component 2
MYEKTGIVTVAMLQEILPSQERRAKGPYAIFECFQPIPCNPCFTACRLGAVELMQDINQIPRINHEKCSGCSLCVSICPGLACFILDETYSEDEGTITIPYEFLPLPKQGQEVNVLDREGNIVGKGKVLKVKRNNKIDHTYVITVAVLKTLLWSIRNIRMGWGE